MGAATGHILQATSAFGAADSRRAEHNACSQGLRALGVENVKPILTRGILIDLAGYKKLPNLPARYEATLADVRGALPRQGLAIR